MLKEEEVSGELIGVDFVDFAQTTHHTGRRTGDSRVYLARERAGETN